MRTHLDEAYLGGTLTKTSAAQHQVVLADQTRVVGALAAVGGGGGTGGGGGGDVRREIIR